MKNILTTIVISVLVFVGAYKFMPLSWLDTINPNFGATITTIQGTDTLSASRTTINDNFSALNTSKFELTDWFATTSAPQLTTLANLATVGTIGTGVWQGTDVGVAHGGTGRSTLTAGAVLYGAGTSDVALTSVCSDGQSLIWASGVPTCSSSSIDNTIDYVWTGLHTFSQGATSSATTTITNSSLTGSPFIINGISYLFPATEGASSTILSTDGSGALTWAKLQQGTFLVDGTIYSTSNTSTTTARTVSIPANTLGANDIIKVSLLTSGTGGNNKKAYSVNLGDGSSTSTLYYNEFQNQVAFPSSWSTIDLELNNNNSQSAQTVYAVSSSTGTIYQASTKATTLTEDFSGQLYIDVNHRVFDGSDSSVVRKILIEVLRN